VREVLLNGTDLLVLLGCVFRIAVVQRQSIRVIHETAAVGRIAAKQAVATLAA